MFSTSNRIFSPRFLFSIILLPLLLAISACGGGSSSVSSEIPPIDTGNITPTVSAGNDQTVAPQSQVELVASASDSDGSIVSYLWVQTEGTLVDLNGASSSQASFVVPNLNSSETLKFIITVIDDQGASSSDSVSINVDVNTSNSPPVITGDFPTQIDVGSLYDYTPQASDQDNDGLTFAIDNKPRWANFDSSSGRLWGTPVTSDNGTYSNIRVSVSDGQSETSLPTFQIAVSEVTDPDCGNISILCVNQTPGDTQEFQSIQDALLEASAGDTIKVFAGEYNGFVVERSGTAGAPIVIKAVGQVNLTGNAGSYGNVIRFQDVSYVQVDGFKIIKDGTANPYNYDYACIAARGATAGSPMFGLEVRNMEVTGCSPAGMYFSQAHGLVLENNFIHDNTKDQQGGRGMGVYLSNASTDNVVVRNNVITDNANAGIHLNGDTSVGGDGIQTGHLFENNFIVGNGQNGINMDGIQSSLFINNVLAGNANHGIRDFQIDASAGAANLIMVNNTFYGNGGSAAKFTADAGGHVLFNNLLVANVENIFNMESSDAQMSNNLISTDSTLFMNAASRDFRIKSGSEPVDGGAVSLAGTNAPTSDFNNFQRTSIPDIGAYELGSEAVSPQAVILER